MLVEIPDSDEDVDDDDDDDNSLESLEDLFDRRKGGHSTSLSSSSPVDDEARLEAERVKTLSLFTSNLGKQAPLIGKDKIRELRAKEQAYTFNIDRLLDDHFDDEEVENSVRKAREDVHAAIKAAKEENNPALDKKLLAAVATTEDGDQGVARLMDAVDRTEALASEPVFLFFGVNGLNDWSDQPPFEYPFAEHLIPEQCWQAGDNVSRSMVYASGYMSDLAALRKIPDEALNWTFEHVVIEQSDDVRQAYIECLSKASLSWTRTNVTARDVQNIFQTLGADNTSLQDSVDIKPRYRLYRDPPQRDPKYLLSALDLFKAICADMDFLALSKLTSMLCRLAIDQELMSDGSICEKVEELLDLLLSLPDIEMSSHVAERMLADVGCYLKDASLQARLLSHIMPTSSLACQTRIILAQIFLFRTKSPAQISPSQLKSPKISLDLLTKYISTSPDFATRRHKGPSTVDYTALRARTYILDIAISDGGRSSAEEHAFNKSVDRLADAVQTIQVAIHDAGASYMARTLAKDDLRALHARLLYSVRTEPRPKRHIFDGKTLRDVSDVRSEEQGKGFMKRFLERKTEKEEKQKQEVGEVKTHHDSEHRPQEKEGEENDESTPTAIKPEISVSSTDASSSSEGRSETETLIRRQLGLASG